MSVELNERAEVEIGQNADADWLRYSAGVAALLKDAGVPLTGADLLIASELPAGAGLSSSAALEAATAVALLALAGAAMDPLELAILCRRAEIEYAGVNCGIMDQLAVLCGRAGHAMLLDCDSLELSYVPVPETAALIVIDTGLPRTLAASAYNERVSECVEAARLLGLPSLREAEPEMVSKLTEPLQRRARHVITENQRVFAFVAALQRNDLGACGELMNASHASLRDDYEVSSPGLERVVAAALEVDGVLGAKLTGAGFGGSVVVLAEDHADAADIARRTRSRSAWRVRASPGASLKQMR